MKLIYKPGDGEAQTWDFVPGDMGNNEAEMIERRTGFTYDEFVMKVQQGSALARRALLWTFLRRTHHILRFEDVEFTNKELELEYTVSELIERREVVAKMPETPGTPIEAVLATIDAQIEEARAKDPLERSPREAPTVETGSLLSSN